MMEEGKWGLPPTLYYLSWWRRSSVHGIKGIFGLSKKQLAGVGARGVVVWGLFSRRITTTKDTVRLGREIFHDAGSPAQRTNYIILVWRCRVPIGLGFFFNDTGAPAPWP